MHEIGSSISCFLFINPKFAQLCDCMIVDFSNSGMDKGRQGHTVTKRDKQGQAGTNGNVPGLALLVPALSLLVPALSLLVPACPSFSLCVPALSLALTSIIGK